MKKKLPKKLQKYAVLLIITIVTCIGLYIFFNSKEVIAYEPPKPLVEIEKPELRVIENSIILNGHIEAESMIPVVPFVNGTIIEYLAKPGEYVKEGQILAKIDPKPFELQLSQAKAAYLGYEKTYKRISALWDAKAVTRQEYETITAQRDAAKAQYELAKLQLSYATVTTPIEGTILTAPQYVGSIGNTSEPVAIIASMDKLVVKLMVPEKHFDLFSKERDRLEAYIIRETENTSEEVGALAVIDSIAPYVDAYSKTFEVKFRLSEKLEEFRPGMYIKAKLTYEKRNDLLTLPQRAKKSDGSLYIYEEETRTVCWINFDSEIYSEEYFSVPNKYFNKYFIVAGQQNLMDGQAVNTRVIK